mgnify:CR=1 FL=1
MVGGTITKSRQNVGDLYIVGNRWPGVQERTIEERERERCRDRIEIEKWREICDDLIWRVYYINKDGVFDIVYNK